MKLKKIISVFLFVVAIFLIGCNEVANKISFSKDQIELKVGEKYELKPILEKEENISYVLDSDGIVTIDGNIITAVKEGTVVIKASFDKYHHYQH